MGNIIHRIKINNEEEFNIIQKILLLLGYRWFNCGSIQCLESGEMPYIDKYGNLGKSIYIWDDGEFERIPRTLRDFVYLDIDEFLLLIENNMLVKIEMK